MKEFMKTIIAIIMVGLVGALLSAAIFCMFLKAVFKGEKLQTICDQLNDVHD